MVKYVKIHIFSHFTWLPQKKPWVMGEKLLTYLNSALKALLGFDIFPHVPKKKVKFCCLVSSNTTAFMVLYDMLLRSLVRGYHCYIFTFSLQLQGRRVGSN